MCGPPPRKVGGSQELGVIGVAFGWKVEGSWMRVLLQQTNTSRALQIDVAANSNVLIFHLKHIF